MEFFETIRRRRSVQSFCATPVTPDVLERVLDAANAAPSAGNSQAYEIYVVANQHKRSALARAAYDQFFLVGAPVALVFCANAARARRYGKRGEQLYAIQDATIACTFSMLAATVLGLSTAWVGAFQTDEVRRIIRAPADLDPVAILPIGRAAEEPGWPGRRSLNELVHYVD